MQLKCSRGANGNRFELFFYSTFLCDISEFVMMGPTSGMCDGEQSIGKSEENNNSIKSVDVNVRGSPSKDDVEIQVVISVDKSREKNNNIRNLEPVKVRISHVSGERVKNRGKTKTEFSDLNLDEIRYIDENEGMVEVDLDGSTRVEETDLDKE